MAYHVVFPHIPYVHVTGRATRDSDDPDVARAAAQALLDGSSPLDLLIVAPRSSAIESLRARIARHVGTAVANHLRICTARDAELAVLQSPDAQAFFGRKMHLLMPFEEPFFLQDVLTCGVKHRRLREMLRFLHRCVTELEDRDPAWLVSDEEREVWGLATSSLTFMGAIHPAEVSNLAATFLQRCPGARKAAQVPRVFVDDFASCNRASQLFLALVARDELCVGWGALGALAGDDPYPYAAGLDELLAANPHAAVYKAACTADAQQAPNAIVQMWHNPAEEFEQVANLAVEHVAAGGAPGDVYVVTPNPTWSANVARALEARGLRVSTLRNNPTLQGDPRDLGRSATLQLYTALRLLVDPDDPCAWRCWCGFGDHLAGSLALSHLRNASRQSGLTLPQALREAAGSTKDPAEQRHVVKRYQLGCKLLNTASGRTGQELLNALCAVLGVDATDISLPLELANIGADATADDLVDAIDHNLLHPTFIPSTVMVGDADALVGQTPQLVVISGFVNGFVPKHLFFDATRTTPAEQTRTLAREAARARAAAMAASRMAVFTGFMSIGLDDAKRLDLKSERIYVEDGSRRCRTSPSVVLKELGL